MNKSHRKIQPELIGTDKPKPPKPKKVDVDAQKIPNSLQPKLRHKATAKYRQFKQTIKNRVHRMLSNQTEKAIRKHVTDKTWYGKVLFAVLDVLPLPNIHEVWKAVQKEIPDAPMKEKVKLFWAKVDGVRTAVAIAISLASYYQIHN